MQLRKGLVATATAAAVLTSGVTVANAAEATPTVSTATTKTKEGSSVKDMSPKEIQEWIAVVTAVISLLGTLATFANKYIKP